jgi:hypothetical protein
MIDISIKKLRCVAIRSCIHSGVLVLVFLTALGLCAAGYYLPIAHVMGVQPIPPGFADARAILLSLDLQAAGIDPIQTGQYCYEHGWLWLGALLGLGSRHAVAVGLVFDMLYVAAVIALIQKIANAPAERVWLVVLAISPAAFLLLERANLDGPIFALVVLSVFAVARLPFLAWACLMAGFSMKIYPLSAFAAFAVMPWKKLAAYAGLTVATILLFVFVTWHDYAALSRSMPLPTAIAFGRLVPVQLAQRFAGVPALVANIAYFAAFAGAVWYGWTKAAAIKQAPDQIALTAYLAGAGIFLGTSLMASSFNYRLVFCLLCVPVLVRLAKDGAVGSLRTIAKYGLWSLAAVSWYMPLLNFGTTKNLGYGAPKGVIDFATHGVGIFGGTAAIFFFAVVTAALLRPVLERLWQEASGRRSA